MANAGGVVVSYFEWVQDRYGYFWPEAEVNLRLEEKMVAAYAALRGAIDRYDLVHDLRTAAYTVAMQRILEARRLRGLYAVGAWVAGAGFQGTEDRSARPL